MKTKKLPSAKKHSAPSKKNPFIKLKEDKERIAKAFKEDRPLSSLGISFVKPL